MFTDIVGKQMCLIRGGNVAVIKKYNPRRHYEPKHQDKLKDLNTEPKKQKVEFKKTLAFQKIFFTKAKSSEAAVKQVLLWQGK